MTAWPSTRAKQVLAALLRMGWTVKRQTGSHRVLARPGWPDAVFSFHDDEEIGPRMLARIAKHTGLRPEDLERCRRWGFDSAALRGTYFTPRKSSMCRMSADRPSYALRGHGPAPSGLRKPLSIMRCR